MATSQIQNTVNLAYPNIVRDSAGYLYVAYHYTPVAQRLLTVAKSTDNGATWTEYTTNATGIGAPSIAIDSNDIVHLLYVNSTGFKVMHRTFAGTAFGSETTAFDGGATAVSTPAVAIDSMNQMHVIFSYPGNGSIQTTIPLLYYIKWNGSSWSSPTTLDTARAVGFGFYAYFHTLKIVCDINDYLHVTYFDKDTQFGGASNLRYTKYTSFWEVAVTLDSDANQSSIFGGGNDPIVDTSGNVWVIYSLSTTWGSTTYHIYYKKYDAGTGLWGSRTQISTATGATGATSLIDSNNRITVIFQRSNNLLTLIYNGSWSAETTIFASDATNTYSTSQASSTYSPIISAVNTNRHTAGYYFLFSDFAFSVNILMFFASSDLAFPAAVTANYSREASASLNASDTDLTNLFSNSEYTNVATVDNQYASQTATNQYAVFQFKNKSSSNLNPINVTWTGRSSVAPTSSTVYLQILNRNSGLWETLASNSAAAVNVNFTLTGQITTNLSNYYDGGNWVSCRVYQATNPIVTTTSTTTTTSTSSTTSTSTSTTTTRTTSSTTSSSTTVTTTSSSTTTTTTTSTSVTTTSSSTTVT